MQKLKDRIEAVMKYKEELKKLQDAGKKKKKRKNKN